MKKFIYSALAAIGLLLSPACSDENEVLNSSGNEALVSFNVNLADGINTKAISDGTWAKQLFVRVFEDVNGSAGQEITGLALKDQEMTNLQKDVSFTLVKGKTYHFLFWAQAYSSGESAPFSIDVENHNVTVAYNGKANDEKRDAFYAVKTINVSGSFEEGVTLNRPFAQLNFLTTKEDILAAINAGQNVNQTSITISSAARTLSPFGTVSVSNEMQNVSFEAYEVPFRVSGGNVTSESSVYIKDDGTTSALAEGTQYFYLATTYFLVNNEPATDQALVDVNMKVEGAEGDGLKVSSVPVRMNYRTNIYGNLLTSTGTFNVTINPIYNQNNENDINRAEPAIVATTNGIIDQINNGARDITCTAEISSATTIDIPKVFNSANNDTELILKFTNVAENASINLQSTTGSNEAPSDVKISTNNGAWTVSLITSSVTFTNGTAQSIEAATASNTLIIGEDMTVQTINATEGNVEVYGQVGTSSTPGSIQATSKILIGSTATVNGTVEAQTVGIVPGADTSGITNDQSNFQCTILTADDLFAFAKQVNEAHNTYAGQTVVLNADIDLQNELWEPIGQTGATQFMGTFEGQNHTISNLTIDNTDEGGNCSTGLFGWLNSATVKNVNVNTAIVTGHHNVGVIAGYLETSGCTIENCHVANATISCTSVNNEANGDKCGGIVGHAGNAGVKVSGCTVANSSISAGRDAGQVVGAALTANVENCSAENVTVTANGSSTGANINNEVIGRVL